jgi:hypothetical protein
MSSADDSNIHRRLDEAFAGIAMTAELQDLKEELRGNLAARVDDLVARGIDAASAARMAIDELGDIRELIGQIEGAERAAPAGADEQAGHRESARPQSGGAAWNGAYQVNRVRPKPLFVIRTVILSLVLAASVLLVALGALSVLAWPSAVLVLVCLGVALPGGIVVADSLRQETSQHYPLPGGRSALYGMSAAIGLMGLALIGLYLADLAHSGLIVSGAVLAVVAIVGFVWLGTTQTNRTKPWVRTVQREQAATDRFSQDPVAAARFGIYTVVLWILTFAVFAVVSATTGFAWSWLVFPLGFAAFMLMLARMMFPAAGRDTGKEGRRGR